MVNLKKKWQCFFVIENMVEHENVINVRQTRRHAIIADPFTLSDRLFIKHFRLTKEIARNLIELLRPHIVTKNRSSALDLNTKVSALFPLPLSCYFYLPMEFCICLC